MRPLRLLAVPLVLAAALAPLSSAAAAPVPAAPAPAAAAVPAPAAPAAGGSFSVLTYNVAGLPELLSSGDPAVNTPDIGRRLAPYTVVNVQEDFNYHAALYANDTHPHRTPTSGGVPFGSGLNTLSHLPYSGLDRVRWEKCNGTDCLTPKGFTFTRIRLAEGVHVDVYNLHPNAGSTEADLAARRSNTEQLSRDITRRSAGNAVIVMGDTNTRYTRAADRIRTLIADNGLADPWVQLVRGGQEPAVGTPGLVCDPAAVTDACEVVDKILYRGSAAVTLTATRYSNADAAFRDAAGKPLSDHYPIAAEFTWARTERVRTSDLFGGPHGTPFTDVDRIPPGATVRTLSLRGGERLDQVAIGLSDGTALVHGGGGGRPAALTLDAGEHLTSVTLTRGQRDGRTRVFSARFGTDRGRSVAAGTATADAVTWTAPAGWQIAGFHGRSGAEVDELGVVYVPIGG